MSTCHDDYIYVQIRRLQEYCRAHEKCFVHIYTPSQVLSMFEANYPEGTHHVFLIHCKYIIRVAGRAEKIVISPHSASYFLAVL